VEGQANLQPRDRSPITPTAIAQVVDLAHQVKRAAV
jgi:hypothetical protein